MRNILPWLALLFTAMLGGSSFPIIRYMMGYITPMDLLALTFIPATIIALVLLPLLYGKKVLKAIKKDWWFFLLQGGLVVFGFHLLVNYVETVLPASATALIVGTWPIVTVIFGWLFIGEKLERRKVAGCLIAFAGAGALILIGSGEEAAKMDIPATTWVTFTLLGLLAPLAGAGVTIASRWYMTRGGWDNGTADPVMYTLLIRLPTGLMALVFWRGEGLQEAVSETPSVLIFWLLIALLAFSRTGGFMLWNWALKQIEAGSTAIFSYMGTVFSLVFSAVLLGEHIGVGTMIGAAGIITGVVVANLDKWKKGVPKHAPLGKV